MLLYSNVLFKFMQFGWWKWLNDHESKLSNEPNLTLVLPRYMLPYVDKLFGGNIVHQIARSSSSFRFDTIKKILDYVCIEGHGELIFAKDNDGDIPLHSAIRSKADQSTILLFATACSHTHSILLVQNNKRQTPLELTFALCHWPGVEVLLMLSVQYNVLTFLTGIRAGVPQSETLLHEAFESGHIDYFQILLDVCKNLNESLMRALLFPDEKGNTPWYYLMSRNKYDEIEQVLSLLNKYQIDVNLLYTDTQTKSTLLHEASRIDDKQCITLLKKYNAKNTWTVEV